MSNIHFINLNLAARTVSEAIQELHRGILSADGVTDVDSFLRDLNRESLSTNCLDAEIALQHARTTAVNQFVLAIGRSTNGVVFEGWWEIKISEPVEET